MNAIIFANLLKDQNALRHLDSDILQALLVEYPYCQPLRRLMREKTFLVENEAPIDPTKKKASNFPADIISNFPDSLIRDSDFNRGSPSSPFNRAEISDSTIKTIVEEESLAEMNLEADLEEEVLYFEIPDRKVAGMKEKNEPPTEVTMGKKKDKHIIKKIRTEVLKTPVKKIEPEEISEEAQSPNPKGKFRSWQERILPIHESDTNPEEEKEEEEEIDIPDLERLELVSNKPKRVKKKSLAKAKKKKKSKKKEIVTEIETKASENAKKKIKVKHFARESIKNKPSLISETLANLLAKQGHLEKSIAMYEKLRLLIPEKSDFFASQIEKLKHL